MYINIHICLGRTFECLLRKNVNCFSARICILWLLTHATTLNALLRQLHMLVSDGIGFQCECGFWKPCDNLQRVSEMIAIFGSSETALKSDAHRGYYPDLHEVPIQVGPISVNTRGFTRRGLQPNHTHTDTTQTSLNTNAAQSYTRALEMQNVRTGTTMSDITRPNTCTNTHVQNV